MAGERGHRGLCEKLVVAGADPNEVNGACKYSLLHNAVAAKNYGFAVILLELDAESSPRASNGATPLHFAARSGQQYMIARLLKSGANVDEQDNKGQAPLHYAIRKNDNSMVKFLIRQNCDVNLPDNRGLAPAQLAEKLNFSEIADVLRDNGATEAKSNFLERANRNSRSLRQRRLF